MGLSISFSQRTPLMKTFLTLIRDYLLNDTLGTWLSMRVLSELGRRGCLMAIYTTELYYLTGTELPLICIKKRGGGGLSLLCGESSFQPCPKAEPVSR